MAIRKPRKKSTRAPRVSIRIPPALNLPRFSRISGALYVAIFGSNKTELAEWSNGDKIQWSEADNLEW